MTNEEYRAAEGVSRSDLFRLTISPLHFRYEQEHPKPKTPALQFGSAFHKLVLEPDAFPQEFAVLPICDRRTKEGKALFAEFEENRGDKTVVTAEEYTKVCDMRDSVMRNPYARLLLRGEVEQSFFWDDELTGERCKCRPDVLADDLPVSPPQAVMPSIIERDNANARKRFIFFPPFIYVPMMRRRLQFCFASRTFQT